MTPAAKRHRVVGTFTGLIIKSRFDIYSGADELAIHFEVRKSSPRVSAGDSMFLVDSEPVRGSDGQLYWSLLYSAVLKGHSIVKNIDTLMTSRFRTHYPK
jgi:hypothetical protein